MKKIILISLLLSSFTSFSQFVDYDGSRHQNFARIVPMSVPGTDTCQATRIYLKILEFNTVYCQFNFTLEYCVNNVFTPTSVKGIITLSVNGEAKINDAFQAVFFYLQDSSQTTNGEKLYIKWQ